MNAAERVIFGFHTVLARLRADPKSVLEVFLDGSRKDARARDFAAQVESAGVRLMRVAADRLVGMAGGGRHQGVVARVAAQSQKQTLEELLERLEEMKVPPLLLVLDSITDPHNLGACLRGGQCCRRARRDRAQGSRRRRQRDRVEGGERRGRDHAVLHGHQPRARAGRPEGQEYLDCWNRFFRC